MEKLIIDTDIGDDIDDAYALALLARYRRDDVLGVTTVYKIGRASCRERVLRLV